MTKLPDCCFTPTDSSVPCDTYALAIAEIERLRAIALRAQLVVNEWHAYGGVKEPIADQLVALEELLGAEQKADAGEKDGN